jgi:hypothetical protein
MSLDLCSRICSNGVLEAKSYSSIRFYSCGLRLALLGALGEVISETEILSGVYRHGLLHCSALSSLRDVQMRYCTLQVRLWSCKFKQDVTAHKNKTTYN